MEILEKKFTVMDYVIKISFELNTFKNNAEVISIVKDVILFEITHFYSASTNGRQHFDEESSKELMAASDKLFTLGGNENDDDDFEKVIFRQEHPIFNLETILIAVNKMENINLPLLIDRISYNNFTTAYITNHRKTRWQNEIFVNQFDVFKQPYSFLKRKPNFMSPNPIAGDMIDIFYNPGHERRVYGMYLMAAPEMWFGAEALKYFDKGKLLSFPSFKEARQLKDETVYIKLFDKDEPNWETATILALQKSFREWSNMNGIEILLREKIPNHERLLG
ncbi:MAG: hypothetical protein IT271_11270 [Chitinophagales bacterium]|nr:hypothetical protein [Chitinophagales bacterium]